MPARAWHRVYKKAELCDEAVFLLSERKHVWNDFRGNQHVWQRRVRFIGRHYGSRGGFCIHARQWYLSIHLFSFCLLSLSFYLTSRVAFIISFNIPSFQILIKDNERRRKQIEQEIYIFLFVRIFDLFFRDLIIRAWKNSMLYLRCNWHYVNSTSTYYANFLRGLNEISNLRGFREQKWYSMSVVFQILSNSKFKFPSSKLSRFSQTSLSNVGRIVGAG